VKLGYLTLMREPSPYGARRRDPNRFFHDVIEDAVFAEEIGLNSVWLPEHHCGLFGCYVNVGLSPHRATIGMMERFAREMMPGFAGT
jgi:alkanesulfonate monooxygenase SsuD/methylene tetrahydromethanopterin reductase-like flavin-dependent oxidoreductase (luciferase family)